MENKLGLVLILATVLLSGCFGSGGSSDSDEITLENSGLIGIWSDREAVASEDEFYLEFTADGKLVMWDYMSDAGGSFSNCYLPIEYSDKVLVEGDMLYIEPSYIGAEAYFLYDIQDDRLNMISHPERSVGEDKVNKDYDRVVGITDLSPVC